VTGDALRVISAFDQPAAELGELHSRHVVAFGTEIPRALQTLKFAVVGAGGTGSATAELLVRLGARRLTIFDDDTLSLSNTTRVLGSTFADVGRLKVDVLADHLRAIAPDVEVEPVAGRITSRSVARRLVSADVVFGCTDDNAGRARLSRLPYAYSSLVIDCGVQISSTGGEISGIFGRVTSLYRGAPCLLCRNRIDLPRLAAEERPREEQEALVAQGYAPELGATEPAVVTFTASVAAAAVGELIEQLVGYGDSPRPTELILRFHERDVRTNVVASRPGCYCDLGSKADRLGDRGLFLGVNWAS
jgi:molybdopterin/thiamine biosynthesis adenylyltransferase